MTTLAMEEIQETTFKAFDIILVNLLRAGLIPDDLSSRKQAWEIFMKEAMELTNRYDDTEELDDIRFHRQEALASVEGALEAVESKDGAKALKDAKRYLQDAVADLTGIV